MSDPQTLFDKVWSAHEIVTREDGESLLWVDRHFVHEGSFHGFDQVKARGGKVAAPALTFGVADHYVPTRGRAGRSPTPSIARMVEQLERKHARATASRCSASTIRARASCMWSAPSRASRCRAC